ncbi:MAG: hypothetical protein PUC00_05750 [Clostridiales bacterium]|nr:hypothetical protein [Clostridiales bacterium]
MKELITKIKDNLRGEKLRHNLKKTAQFLLNPHLVLCWLIAWIITNGWSYILFGVGSYLEIDWMVAVAGAYLTFLWLPISPEKIVTCAIAIALLRWLFPGDQKTLAVLHGWHAKAKAALKSHRARKVKEKAAKEKAEDESHG